MNLTNDKMIPQLKLVSVVINEVIKKTCLYLNRTLAFMLSLYMFDCGLRKAMSYSMALF